MVPCMAQPNTVSFKDKLVGKNSGDFPEEHDNWCSEDEEKKTWRRITIQNTHPLDCRRKRKPELESRGDRP